MIDGKKVQKHLNIHEILALKFSTKCNFYAGFQHSVTQKTHKTFVFAISRPAGGSTYVSLGLLLLVIEKQSAVHLV